MKQDLVLSVPKNKLELHYIGVTSYFLKPKYFIKTPCTMCTIVCARHFKAHCIINVHCCYVVNIMIDVNKS